MRYCNRVSSEAHKEVRAIRTLYIRGMETSAAHVSKGTVYGGPSCSKHNQANPQLTLNLANG